MNAIGDFLAGVFGPLSIFWLILGFFQQGHELAQNNESLRRQADELQASVEQQKELIKVSESHHRVMEETARLEQAHMAMSLEPRFSLNFIKSDIVPKGRMFILSLTNAGHAITCVKISLAGHTFEYPMLDSLQAIEIHCPHENVREVVLRPLVQYLNGLEQERSRVFNVYLKKHLVDEIWNVEVEAPNGTPFGNS